MTRALTRKLNTLATLGLITLATNAQGDPLQTTAQKVLDELNALAPIIVTIGIIIGGLAIMFGHSEAWSRLGKIVIGASIIFGAAALINNVIH